MPTEKGSSSAPHPFDLLLEKIREAGFPLVGAVDLFLATEAFATHGERYREWITAGLHGEMGYLERGLDRRLDPRLVFPATKSVTACAIPYRRSPLAGGELDSPRYARYLQGPDYHRHIPKLLEGALGAWAADLLPEEPRPEWKICVDTSAVLERSWAALCGLGWIGKNTLLMHPQYGSYLFLATILIDRESGRVPAPLPSYCGNCTRCLDACPTSAFLRPGTVDSRRCISYLTLEKRGPWELGADERKKMGRWIAGCDICQEVCPFNLKPSKLPETWPSDARDEKLILDWEKLSHETEAEYRERIKDSALSRIKYPEMRRNLENAEKNRGDA